jgi:transglutaminase-like putative cysteine protease
MTMFLAFLSYLLLLDAAVETVRSGAPDRWWIAAAAGAYLAISLIVARTPALAARVSWTARAVTSVLFFLTLLAATAWRPGGLTDGITAMRQPTATLLEATMAAATLLAGVALVWAPRWVPVWGRAAGGLLASYGVAGFAAGIAASTPFAALFHGGSVWLPAPYWLQGAFLGALVVIPLGLIAVLTGARVTPASWSWSWKWRESLALCVSLAMAVSGLAVPGPASGPGTGPVPAGTESASGTKAPADPAAVSRAQATLAAAMKPQDLAAIVDVVERSAARAPRSALDVDAKAAELGPDVTTLFTFVRDHIREQVYEGVLRGPRGALLARAGNAFDKALLLGALLKHHGLEVRYVRGRLGPDRAAQLVAQMLTSMALAASGLAAGGVEGAPAALIAAGGALNDAIAGEWSANLDTMMGALNRNGLLLGGPSPAVGRAALLEEAANHLWVEIRQGDRWLPLDPSFSDAQPGQTFAGTAETLGEVPRSLFHGITIRQEVEERIGGSLKTHDVLRYESTASDLNATPVTVSYELSAVGTHWYATPVLQAGATRIAGETFGGAAGVGSKVAGGFGAVADIFGGGASTADGMTGAWLVFEFSGPSGRTESVRREVFDRIGARARIEQQEAAAELAVFAESAGVPAPLSGLFSCWFNAGPAHPDLTIAQLTPQLPALRSATSLLATLQTSGRTPTDEEKKTLGAALNQILPALLSATAASFYSVSDSSRALMRARKPDVWFYEATPRLAIVSFEPVPVDGGTFDTRTSIDLRRNELRAVAQDASGSQVASSNLSRGVLDGVAEHILGDVIARAPARSVPTSTVAIMDEARAAGTEIGTFRNRASIEALPASEAKSRMLSTLADDRVFVAPVHPVSVAGGERLGWWQVDLATGETVGVVDSGLHGVEIGEWVQTNMIYVNAAVTNAGSGFQLFLKLAFVIELALIACFMYLAATG